ncbi:hypothetical protein [Streptomyces sp. NRRL F-4474]|uniref:Rv1733c family protein n=1 Tax=Streptomyces sp. NRRL F-4474 TaxID=1463851 RepID=UPI00068B5579|nr:hypothetical protein [Streptomyces sp. NRRL F-4474]
MDDDRTPGAANPLRRKADRTRVLLHAAFAVACLLAVVCGIAVGRAVWIDAGHAAETLARHRHVVTATAVDGTSYRTGPRPGDRPVVVAPVTWQYPADRRHADTVPVPAQTRKGDTVAVWVDDRGDAATAPPVTADLALRAFGFGAAALTGGVLLAGALARLGIRLVDARSARAWESEWEEVEPLWTGRLHPGPGADDG